MPLPRPTAPEPAPQTARGERPEPRAERLEFFKAHHIGKVGTSAVIRVLGDVKVVDGNYGEQLVCTIQHEGRKFIWGVNLDSPNYRLLFKRFGDDEHAWVGPVNVVVKQGVSSAYVVVADQQDESSKQDQPTDERPRGRGKK